MKIFRKNVLAFVLTITLAASSSALAADAWISVPSTPDSTDTVQIKGGNLPALSTVTVRFDCSNGIKTEQLENVSDAGTLKVSYIPAMPGGCRVTVLDQAGNEIGSGNFGYAK
jgi:hypothetical protein